MLNPAQVVEAKKTLKVGYPIVLAQLGHTIQGIVDGMMVGHVGATELAASAFVLNVLSIPMVMMMGACTAISVMVAQAFGGGRPKECGNILYTGLLNSAVLVLIMVLGLYFLSDHLSLFSQPAEVLEICRDYYFYLTFSLVPMVLFVAFRQFSEGLGKTIEPMLFLAGTLVLNIFLNWVLIFGNLGAPRMELDGAGLATLLARVITLTAFAIFILSAKKYKPYRIKLRQYVANMVEYRSMIKIGAPSATQYLFEVGAFSMAGIMAGWISTTALAAHTISINLATVTFMVVLGTSFAASIRTGQSFGAKDIEGVKNIGVSSLVMCAGFMILSGLTFVTLRGVLPKLYVSEVQVISLAASMLLIVAIFQVFDGVQAVTIGLLRGLSDVNIPTLITFFAYWLFALPLMYALAFTFDFGPLGIWVGLAGGLAVSSSLLVLRYFKVISRLSGQPVNGEPIGGR